MNWKKFLKPDLRKIVLTIILSLFVFFINYEIWLSTSAVIGISHEAYWCGIVSSEECPYTNVKFCEEIKRGCESYNLEICKRMKQEENMKQLIFYLIVIMVNYLISCLIVWIYDKYFKKVNKK